MNEAELEPVPLEVVGGLIERHGKVLITRRPLHKAQGGLWEFPGGKIHPGESPAQALVRELQEELGVRVEVLEPFCVVAHRYTSLNTSLSIRLHILECALTGEDPRCVEVLELAWVAPIELPAYALAAADLPVVELLLKRPVRTAQP